MELPQDARLDTLEEVMAAEDTNKWDEGGNA